MSPSPEPVADPHRSDGSESRRHGGRQLLHRGPVRLGVASQGGHDALRLAGGHHGRGTPRRHQAVRHLVVPTGPGLRASPQSRLDIGTAVAPGNAFSQRCFLLSS